MKFCPKCGSMMYPKKEENKVVYVCTACGYKELAKKDENPTLSISKKIIHTPKEEVIVVDTNTQVLPIDNSVICPKCGSKGAYFWQMQTRSGDEPTTIFYKCKKCGYVWREY
ncbi:MAG: transcription factor S [Candidatus Asgardarchaeia archaeon]